MNKKGFTLIELVTVIALLGIISVIAFVSIFQVINKSKVSNCENLLLSIETATKNYVSDNRYNVEKIGSYEYIDGKKIDKISGRTQKYIEIKASNLVSNNYLSSPIIDPFANSFDDDNKIEDTDISIRIYLLDNYTVGYVPVSDTDKTESIIIRNKSGNVVNCSSKQW